MTDSANLDSQALAILSIPGPVRDPEELEIAARFHPMASIIPMRSDKEIDELVAELRRGELKPVVTLYEDKILDGRATALACHRAGIMPNQETYPGNRPLHFLFVKMGPLRQLTQRQRVMIAARAATAKVGANQYSDGMAVPTGTATSVMNVKVRTVNRAKAIIRQGINELIEMVEREEISLARGEKIAKLAADDQLDELTRPSACEAPEVLPSEDGSAPSVSDQKAQLSNEELPSSPTLDSGTPVEFDTTLVAPVDNESAPPVSDGERQQLDELERTFLACSRRVQLMFLRQYSGRFTLASGTPTRSPTEAVL